MTASASINDITQPLVKELDFRANDGVEVSLVWQPESNSLFVEVIDAKTCAMFRLDVAAEEALDAFQHPFAYAAFRGIRLAETQESRFDSTPCEV